MVIDLAECWIKNEIPPCEIRPYDHLWDMYYDEFEDENLENEPSLDEWTAHEYPREYGIAT